MTGLPQRPLGRTGLTVPAIGFGSFKIGRNQGIKYPQGYDLPDVAACERLLDGLLDLGVNLIDTAPAYGLAEQRLGPWLARQRDTVVLSTKVGEQFADGQSTYDFTAAGMLQSVEHSLRCLQTEAVDLLLLHTHGGDLQILQETPAVETLLRLRERGLARAIGLSGKTPAAAEAALGWADVLMVEYHAQDDSHANVMEQAHARGIGVLVKKGLASGHLSPREAIGHVLRNPHVDSLVLGGLNLEHFRQNCDIAASVRPDGRGRSAVPA